MSEEKKAPKPFLKKGTRKYLSNATVRSLNQKPNIIEYAEEGGNDVHVNKSNSMTFGRSAEQEIKVTVKRNVVKENDFRNNNSNEMKRTKENKPANQEKSNAGVGSTGKKKSSQLEDYLGGTASATKAPRNRNSLGKQREKVQENPPIITMAAQLAKQEEIQSDEDDSMNQKLIAEVKINQNTKVQQNVNHQFKAPPKYNPASVKKIEPVQQESNEINFNSQSDQEIPSVPAKSGNKKTVSKMHQNNHLNPIIYPERAKWAEEEQQNDEVVAQDNGPSKVLQKYYKKQQPKSSVTSTAPPARLELKDIPVQLKEQIINEYLISKKSDLQKKLEQLSLQSQKVKKDKEKYEEENKRLAKEREQFQRQKEERVKEFEQKIKSENAKLSREKRYMKDQQTSGKADWKLKNDLEEMRVKLQQSESEKKKLKADSQRQIDRLKKKIDELCKQNQSLKQQMKFIEMEKIELIGKQKQVEKKVESKNYWEGAPTQSFLNSFADNNFTLLDYDVSCFNYENLEHYQYYLTKKDEQVELEKEQSDSKGKIIRVYKNGKQEIEYVNKVLKEIFPSPFKFTVVSHINGDIKLIYPSGIQVYYDMRSQITEIKISAEKTIYNFHKLSQIQMKFKSFQLGQVHQLRKGNMLIRSSRAGEEKFKINQKGQIERIM